MQTRYVAYGLQLRSSFALPGMTPRTAEELPSLALRLTTPAALELAWGGTRGDLPAWEGRLGDGRRLRIERGTGGEVLFSYGQQALFRLDASQELLECAPLQDGLDWQRVLLSKVLCNVSVMRGYEGLHAAALDTPGGVVAVAGPSGAGKSTLAIELMRRGWPLFADDMLTLRRAPSRVRAYPATPHISVSDELPDAVELEELGTIVANLPGERWMVAEQTSHRPRNVRALCLLERGPGLALDARVLPANPLLLAPYMLGFEGDGERQSRRFHLYADLMGSTTLIELTGGPEDSPRELADLLERMLAYRPVLAGSPA
jgi:hypothetical protein